MNVLVTGANRGIGLSLARQLAARGDTVLATCRTPTPELGALGVEVLSGIDVGSDECVSVLRDAVAGRPLDCIVNNAGILEVDNLRSLDFESVRRQFEVNALGPLRVTRALKSSLGAGAKLVILTSRVGSIGDNASGSLYGYRMSKAAVNMAAVNLAHDLRPAGVAVGLFHPGMVATDMSGGHGMSPEESAANLIRRIDELTMETSGRFLHANGEPLPW